MLAGSDRIRAVIHQQRELADRMQQFRSLDDISPEQQRRMDQFAKQQELLREFEDAGEAGSHPHTEGFFKKVKEFWGGLAE